MTYNFFGHMLPSFEINTFQCFLWKTSSWNEVQKPEMRTKEVQKWIRDVANGSKTKNNFKKKTNLPYRLAVILPDFKGQKQLPLKRKRSFWIGRIGELAERRKLEISSARQVEQCYFKRIRSCMYYLYSAPSKNSLHFFSRSNSLSEPGVDRTTAKNSRSWKNASSRQPYSHKNLMLKNIWSFAFRNAQRLSPMTLIADTI